MNRLAMRLIRPRFRLKTLCLVVAMSALALGVYASEQRRRVQHEVQELERTLAAYSVRYGKGALNCRGPALGLAAGTSSQVFTPKGLDFREGSE